MTKNLQTFAIIFLGICILLSSIVLAKSIDNNNVDALQVQSEQQVSQGRYEFTALSHDYYLVFDSYTGEFWKKVDGNEWTKYESPQK